MLKTYWLIMENSIKTLPRTPSLRTVSAFFGLLKFIFRKIEYCRDTNLNHATYHLYIEKFSRIEKSVKTLLKPKIIG